MQPPKSGLFSRDQSRGVLQRHRDRAYPFADLSGHRAAEGRAIGNSVRTCQECRVHILCQDAQERNALYYAMGNPTEKSRWEILRLLLDRGCSASEAGTVPRFVATVGRLSFERDQRSMLLADLLFTTPCKQAPQEHRKGGGTEQWACLFLVAVSRQVPWTLLRCSCRRWTWSNSGWTKCCSHQLPSPAAFEGRHGWTVGTRPARRKRVQQLMRQRSQPPQTHQRQKQLPCPTKAIHRQELHLPTREGQLQQRQIPRHML